MNEKMTKTIFKLAVIAALILFAYWLGRTANHDARFYVLRGEKIVVVDTSTGEQIGALWFSGGRDIEVQVWKVNK